MRIKSLEVVGFKSFLEKTSFDFSSNCTGIVGPNGCGKSNVVDAIKWVTGELSFKELRGRTMQDLIFAGSELKPPTGMAEVALTLDNSDRSAPPDYNDYAEIKVLRRVFRDGTSEFFINKTPCRLRDVIDIFLDTGVGQSSYSIIEQGRVGAIVASKPDDLRNIIEEAAGITKYKHRKKVALRKMDYSKQNLLRVGDVIAELKRQIAALERQARRAEKFKNIRDRARSLDIALSGRKYAELDLEVSKLVQDEEIRTMEIDTYSAELRVLEAKYESDRVEALEKEKELQSLQEGLYQRANQISALESRAAALRQEAEHLTARSTSDRNQALALEQREAELFERLRSITEEQRVLHSEVAILQGRLVELEQRAQLGRDKLATVEEEIAKKKADLLRLVASEAELTNQVQSARDFQVRLRSDVESRQRELDTAAQEFTELEAKFTERQRSLGVVVQLRFGFEREYAEYALRLEKLQAENVEMERALSENAAKLEGARSRLKALEEFERTYQGYAEGSRTILEREKSRQDEASNRLHGVLGQIIRPHKGYERAFEAILTDRISCLVVEDTGHVIEAIEYLKEKGGGRSSFFARSMPWNRQRPSVPQREGILGYLYSFMDCDAEVMESVHAILGDVLVVSDLRRAVELRGEGIPTSMVTPDGDVLTRQGIFIGGSWGQELRVLEVHREIDDLRSAVAGLEENRASLSRGVMRIQREIASTRRTFLEIEASLDSRSRDVIAQEKEFERLQEGVSRCRQRVSVIHMEIERLQHEALKVAESEVKLERDRTVVVEERASVEARLASLSEEAEAVKLELQGESEKLTAAKVAHATVLEKVEAYSREIAGIVAQRESAARDRVLFSQSAVDHETEAARRESEASVLDRTRLVEIESHEKAKEALGVVRSAYDLMSESIRNGESSIKENRAKLHAQEDELNALRMKIQEERMTITHLEEQISERHGISLVQHIHETGFQSIAEEEVTTAEEELQILRDQMMKIGNVHLGAIEELAELEQRYEFLNKQKEDLDQTLDSLATAIRKINATTRERFQSTFEDVNTKFQDLFPKLFRGGKARLFLTDPENLLETGVEIQAQPPGKKLQSMNLLSGGEKALTAIALIFAIFMHKAPPFCLLDEVDAPLDDANVGRFSQLVKEMSAQAQFVIITHNKLTMEIAEQLFGVTMEEPGVSRIVSVRVSEKAAQTALPESALSVA